MSYPPQGYTPIPHQVSHQKGGGDALAGTIAVTVVEVGDVVFANGWRLTEENGIALVDEKGNIIRRWSNG